ncbi:hypothetical protein E6W39_18855 [Kitasatospora acidiphila]|uniref:Uncharacterized protein n=1 Tax=Kitasatospora acidiphila TaxID=2567942 RepID=A0A540W6D7_9ACTN|nr:hypothetical protein [Kitasatospora acidiphila]TQF03914.1 hypothetical protein E6W39_18855 [Kitasatospora acidiphila]
MQRIKWDAQKYGGYCGSLGRFEFFEINLSDKYDDSRPWRLLPKSNMVPGGILGFETIDAAKEHAEQAMTAFLNAIGAQWKDEQ